MEDPVQIDTSDTEARKPVPRQPDDAEFDGINTELEAVARRWGWEIEVTMPTLVEHPGLVMYRMSGARPRVA